MGAGIPTRRIRGYVRRNLHESTRVRSQSTICSISALTDGIVWPGSRLGMLKARESEQGPKESMASLKRLLFGLPKIQALIESTEFTLQKKVSFDWMLKLAESKAQDWVRIMGWGQDY